MSETREERLAKVTAYMIEKYGEIENPTAVTNLNDYLTAAPNAPEGMLERCMRAWKTLYPDLYK